MQHLGGERQRSLPDIMLILLSGLVWPFRAHGKMIELIPPVQRI